MKPRAAALALIGIAQMALAQVPPAQPPRAAPPGWDGRLPPVLPPPQQALPQAGDDRRDGHPPPLGYANGYGVPVLILPPLRYGLSLCPDRAPPYFAGGFKPRGPYTAWHGSALPPATGYGANYGYGPQDPYAPDPRDCGPAQSWNGDEGRARQYYIPPAPRR